MAAQIRKVNDRLRESLGQLEIETSVALVQHTHTGEMPPSPDANPHDDFFGAPSTRGQRNKARIHTVVSVADDETEKTPPKSHISRFHRAKF